MILPNDFRYKPNCLFWEDLCGFVTCLVAPQESKDRNDVFSVLK